MTRDEMMIRTIVGCMSFYGEAVSDYQLGMWLDLTEAYSPEEVEKAFKLHLQDPAEGRFKPKPSHIERHLQGTKEDQAAIAWSKAYTALQRVGRLTSVVFDDPAIHTAIEDLGGWPKFCSTSYDELPHLERRFVQAYKAHARLKSTHAPKLLGESELSNRITNFPSAPPVLVGDRQACERVMLTGTANKLAISLSAPMAQPLGQALARITTKEK